MAGTDQRRFDIRVWAARCATLLLFGYMLLFTSRATQWVHPDCAMYLYIGELILDGYVPYVDFVEINPPLVMYLHVIPVWLARQFGTTSVVAFNVGVTCMAGLSALSLWRYLPRLAPTMSEPYRHFVACAWLGFSFVVFAAMQYNETPLPTAVAGTDYGQREHLITLSYLPFMLLRMLRYRDAAPGRVESSVVGVVGGIALCIKPQFIVAAALVELHLAWRHRRLRPLLAPETYAAVVVPLLYALHFAFVPSAMREAFFGTWLPLAQRRYSSYDWPLDHVYGLRTMHATALLAVMTWLPYRQPYRDMVRRFSPVTVFAVGSALVLIQQHKGWPYHIIPMTGCIWLMVAVMLAQVMSFQESVTQSAVASGDGRLLLRIQERILYVRPVLLSLLFMSWMSTVLEQSGGVFRKFDNPRIRLVRDLTTPEDSVIYISTGVQGVFPEMLHVQRKPGSRLLWTFPIAYAFQGHGGAPRGKTESRADFDRRRYTPTHEKEAAALVEMLEADVAERKPAVVVIRHGPDQALPNGVDPAGYLAYAGFQRRALKDYRVLRDVTGWDVYVRDPGWRDRLPPPDPSGSTPRAAPALELAPGRVRPDVRGPGAAPR